MVFSLDINKDLIKNIQKIELILIIQNIINRLKLRSTI